MRTTLNNTTPANFMAEFYKKGSEKQVINLTWPKA